MEGRHVDLTLISAEDLKKVTLIGKMRAYATAWIDPYSRQSTAVDERGGTSPAWNQRLSFLVPEHFFQQPYAQLTIEIYSKATFFDDKFVGAASVPLTEIAQKAAGEQPASTYDVRRRSGKVQGLLRVATRVGDKTTIGPAPAPAPAPYPYSYEQRPFGEPPYPYAPSAAGVPAAAPYGYPPPAGGAYGQGYYQQPPPYYQAQPPSQQRPGAGGLGMGLGAGLLAGAAGGLLVGEMMDNDGDDGGFDL